MYSIWTNISICNCYIFVLFSTLFCTYPFNLMMTSSNVNIFGVTGQWRGALMFSLICAWLNGWVNNGEVGDLRHHRAHYGVTVVFWWLVWSVSASLAVGKVTRTCLTESGGRFKNTYELLNLRALTFSAVNKIHIFPGMGKIFCVQFQRVPLKFHTKYVTHTLKDKIFIQSWNLTNSYI